VGGRQSRACATTSVDWTRTAGQFHAPKIEFRLPTAAGGSCDSLEYSKHCQKDADDLADPHVGDFIDVRWRLLHKRSCLRDSRPPQFARTTRLRVVCTFPRNVISLWCHVNLHSITLSFAVWRAYCKLSMWIRSLDNWQLSVPWSSINPLHRVQIHATSGHCGPFVAGHSRPIRHGTAKVGQQSNPSNESQNLHVSRGPFVNRNVRN